MTKYLLAALVLTGLLEAQPGGVKSATVAPGQQTDIIIAVTSPRVGDLIDILVDGSGDDGRWDIFLPDGRKVPDQPAEEDGVSLAAVPQGDLGRIDPSIRKVLAPGPGIHIIMALIDKPQPGNYRIRWDNRNSKVRTRVAAVFVRVAGLHVDFLRSTPGIKIANAVKVAPASTGIKLRLSLTQSTEAAMIDVATTADGLAIRLRLPDGTVVTQENAKASGLEWAQMRYPPDPDGGDPFAATFEAAILGAIMLPVDGMHYTIQFPAGVRQTGTYTVEVDGQHNTATAEVSAMFVPMESAMERVNEGFRRLTGTPK